MDIIVNRDAFPNHSPAKIYEINGPKSECCNIHFYLPNFGGKIIRPQIGYAMKNITIYTLRNPKGDILIDT